MGNYPDSAAACLQHIHAMQKTAKKRSAPLSINRMSELIPYKWYSLSSNTGRYNLPSLLQATVQLWINIR